MTLQLDTGQWVTVAPLPVNGPSDRPLTTVALLADLFPMETGT